MDYRDLFRSVKRHPGMFVHNGTYDETSAFVHGCDAGNDYCLLDGFREWLVVKLGGYNEFAWSALILYIAFPGHPNPQEACRESPENNRVAIDKLFDLLDEFFEVKGPRHEGLVTIFLQYREWREIQDSFNSAREGPRRMRSSVRKKLKA